MSDTDYLESTRPSSVATTPPADSDENSPAGREVKKDEDTKISKEAKYIEDMTEEERYTRLEYLLEKSAKYSEILHTQMRLVKSRSKKVDKTKRGRPSKAVRGRKRVKVVEESDEEPEVKEEEPNEEKQFTQPALVTGGTLKEYQLEGVAWMASLWENGISGILADEMGLGKTLQTISFYALLRERTLSPLLIVCPLSVLHNWVDEFKKFAPKIPVVMYHGTPEYRADIRNEMALLESGVTRTQRGKFEGEESEECNKFPVVVTTYDIIMIDRKHLSKYNWGFIAVDEGHRLKNMNCKLMQEIKKYPSAGRMILTGTPLHNNLAELWSLLNFVLPDIFSDLNAFQEWFNIPTMQSNMASDRTTSLVSTLHSILKPFLLRRLKVDVEFDLPPKKEYVLYAPLTEKQKSVYEAVLNRSLRQYLIAGSQGQTEKERKDEEERKRKEKEAMLSEGRKLRTRGKKRTYNIDGDDEEYFKKMESGELREIEEKNARDRAEDLALAEGREYHKRKAVLQVNNLHLQNVVMQLRKVCSHPFLFDWPIDPETHYQVINDELVGASGKMLILDRLLTELFKRGHKVLIFSQFTTMLDIIEAWATEFKQWNLCRIDGSCKPEERSSEMKRFQTGGDDPDAPRLFLLSTRSGGLGINLTAADTVIFYDQDWNPQMDMQAQDRAHRIGQTKPVLIFRLVSAHTIENTIMQRANEKRRLEALVIAKGKFKVPGSLVTKGNKDKDSLADLAASLLKIEGEKIEVVPNTDAGKMNVLSDKDLDMLLDRSPEVFADRVKGWTSSDATNKPVEENGQAKTAFAVFEANTDEGNDALANMLGEDLE